MSDNVEDPAQDKATDNQVQAKSDDDQIQIPIVDDQKEIEDIETTKRQNNKRKKRIRLLIRIASEVDFVIFFTLFGLLMYCIMEDVQASGNAKDIEIYEARVIITSSVVPVVKNVLTGMLMTATMKRMNEKYLAFTIWFVMLTLVACIMVHTLAAIFLLFVVFANHYKRKSSIAYGVSLAVVSNIYVAYIVFKLVSYVNILRQEQGQRRGSGEITPCQGWCVVRRPDPSLGGNVYQDSTKDHFVNLEK